MHSDEPLPTSGRDLDRDAEQCADRDAHTRDIDSLFRSHHESLLRFLTAQGHSMQDARDIVQEAYVKILSLDSPGTVSFLRAFLFRTATNVARDRVRRRLVRHRLDPVVFLESMDETESPEPLCCARQELELIQRAVDELPAHCRLAFILVKIDDLSFDDAAVRMGIGTQQVRRYVARAIAHCQKVIRRST